MPDSVTELLGGRWAVPLVAAAAFLLPLLLADLVRGEPTRRVANVTMGPAARLGADTTELARIPDLRPARALPRLRRARPQPAVAAPAAPAPAVTPTTPASPAAPAPATSAPTPAPTTPPTPSGGGQATSGGGSGSFQNSGSSSGEFQSSD